MDRFKFRGLNLKGELIYGNLSIEGDVAYIEEQFRNTPYGDIDNSHEIDIDTLEQCTGLKDKNGVLIYANDLGYDINNRLCQVVWCSCNACYDLLDIKTKRYRQYDGISEVLGNIHQNKGLLNE